jgi:phage tail sheath gpL-like
MQSNAVAPNRIAEIVGYLLDTGDFSESNGNLPIAFAVLGEANTANQAGLDTTKPKQVLSSQQAGQLYGFGSPLYDMVRKFFPSSGGGVSVPVFVYPQAAAAGSVARVQTITITGTATANGTVYINIAGRTNKDGGNYAINVVSGDTPTDIGVKIYNAINNTLASPVIATKLAGVVTCTAKWTGLTSQGITITVDLGDTSLGSTYAVAETVAGSGTPLVAASLLQFGAQWNNVVINGYGLVAQTIGELEAFNGVPDPISPTGRFGGTTFKPFVALCGTLLDDPTTITGVSGRKTQCTIAACPAPLSPGMHYEVAAAYAVELAAIVTTAPHLDVMDRPLRDVPMPALGTVPLMCDYNVRDTYVQLGCSTVDIVSGQYVIKDFITTFRPDGQVPPPFRYVRDLFIDFNIEYGWQLRVKSKFAGHTLCDDNDVVTADKIVQPKMVISEGKAYAIDLGKRALIADVPFMQKNIQANINASNPQRLDIKYPYKRTGMGRIVATTGIAGFNFGKS